MVDSDIGRKRGSRIGASAAGAIRIAAEYAMLFAVRTTQPQIFQPVHRIRQQQRHGRLK
jgi:hypothetical protein